MMNMNKDWLDEQMECAIREKGAIDHFRELENKPSFSGMFQRFIRPAVVSFAFVCAAACAYIPYYGHMARSGYEYSMQQEYDTLRYRGDSPLLDKLNDVIALVNNRKPQEALALLETLESDCEAALAQFGDADEYVIERAQVALVREDISWYRAMSYMQTKKVFKAKSELRKIVKSSSSSHSTEATKILKEVY